MLCKSGLAFRRLELPKLTNHNPCNPSILMDGERIVVSYRGCNYFLREHGYSRFYGSWSSPVTDSQNYMAEISDDLTCLGADFIEDRHVRARRDCLDGIQDLRIFKWRGEIFAVGSGCNSRTFIEKTARHPECTMVLGKIVNNRFEIVTSFNSGHPVEKNWMPWVMEDRLLFIYAPAPFVVLEYDHSKKSLRQIDVPDEGLLPKSSGSSCVMPFGEKFIGVLHWKSYEEGKAVYRHKLFVASKDLRILDVSSEFSFEGEAVEFCAGMAFKGNDLYFSYGIFDEKAVILKMPRAEALDFLFS